MSAWPVPPSCGDGQAYWPLKAGQLSKKSTCPAACAPPYSHGRAAGLHSFKGECDALSDADAHGRQGPLATVQRQLKCCRPADPRTRHAQRMAQRNRTAIGVHAGIIVRNPKGAQRGKTLAGKGFVQFDHVEIGLA